jgi:hypothetical protein
MELFPEDFPHSFAQQLVLAFDFTNEYMLPESLGGVLFGRRCPWCIETFGFTKAEGFAQSFDDRNRAITEVSRGEIMAFGIDFPFDFPDPLIDDLFRLILENLRCLIYRGLSLSRITTFWSGM